MNRVSPTLVVSSELEVSLACALPGLFREVARFQDM